jgi:hypothetical protein
MLVNTRQCLRLMVAGMVVSLSFIGLADAPAQADSRQVKDPRDARLAAKYDIRRVQLINTETRLIVKVTVRKMSSKNVMLNVKALDGRGAPHYARIYRNNINGPGHDVLVQQDAGGPYVSYLCDGLRQRWSKKKRLIVLSLPHNVRDCGGAPLERFQVYTGPWGAGEVRDQVRSPRALLW